MLKFNILNGFSSKSNRMRFTFCSGISGGIQQT